VLSVSTVQAAEDAVDFYPCPDYTMIVGVHNDAGLDDVPDGIKELERAARLGLAGAMITEYRLEHRRYDGSE
jgi:hypothetical protein